MVNDCLFSFLFPFSIFFFLSFLCFLVIRSSQPLFTPSNRSTVSFTFFHFSFLSFRLSKLSNTRERLKSVLFFLPPIRDYYDEHRVARAFILSALKIPALSRSQCFTDASAPRCMSPLLSSAAILLAPWRHEYSARALANFQSHQSSRGFESLGEHYLHLGKAQSATSHAARLARRSVLSIRALSCTRCHQPTAVRATREPDTLVFFFNACEREYLPLNTRHLFNLLFLFLLSRRRPFFSSSRSNLNGRAKLFRGKSRRLFNFLCDVFVLAMMRNISWKFSKFYAL